jgi:hypothetical protein
MNVKSCAHNFSFWLQYVKAIVGPYQLVQSRVAMVKSATSPFWNEDLMFVAAEPFDELLHLLIEERVGNKVSGGDFATFSSSTTTIVGHLFILLRCSQI